MKLINETRCGGCKHLKKYEFSKGYFDFHCPKKGWRISSKEYVQDKFGEACRDHEART